MISDEKREEYIQQLEEIRISDWEQRDAYLNLCDELDNQGIICAWLSCRFIDRPLLLQDTNTDRLFEVYTAEELLDILLLIRNEDLHGIPFHFEETEPTQ